MNTKSFKLAIVMALGVSLAAMTSVHAATDAEVDPLTPEAQRPKEAAQPLSTAIASYLASAQAYVASNTLAGDIALCDKQHGERPKAVRRLANLHECYGAAFGDEREKTATMKAATEKLSAEVAAVKAGNEADATRNAMEVAKVKGEIAAADATISRGYGVAEQAARVLGNRKATAEEARVLLGVMRAVKAAEARRAKLGRVSQVFDEAQAGMTAYGEAMSRLGQQLDIRSEDLEQKVSLLAGDINDLGRVRVAIELTDKVRSVSIEWDTLLKSLTDSASRSSGDAPSIKLDPDGSLSPAPLPQFEVEGKSLQQQLEEFLGGRGKKDGPAEPKVAP